MSISQCLGRLLSAAVASALPVVLSAAAAFGQATENSSQQRTALVASIQGPIGPATTRHVERVIAAAQPGAATGPVEVVVFRIDTPGGLADAMRDVISTILASPVPVVGYVAPPGAHAASAGTYILYATHVAAMAPGTNLGAATPVQIGGEPPGDGKPDPEAKDDGDAADETGDGGEVDGQAAEDRAPEDAMTAKATNDAVAFIRSLAEMHGRNAEWAEKAVREAASLSSAQALEQGVIDLVADDTTRLLAALDGRKVTIAGAERTLETTGIAVTEIEIDAITRLLSILSNPNFALILMMIGFYGIIFEFWNPGAVAPGVIGAISLTLGLYALNQLPLDYAGLALIGLGIVFMVAEAFTPTFGILGLGGLAAFVLGSAMLIDTDAPGYQISWWVIGTMAAVSGSVLILLLGLTMRAYRRPEMAEADRVVGRHAQVQSWAGNAGHVWAAGELWQARLEAAAAVPGPVAGPAPHPAPGPVAGQTVRVRRIEGLTLVIDAPGPGRNGEE